MKAVLSSISDIPENLRSEYVERDGQFVLKVDGELPGYAKADELFETKSKLKRFRDNYTNIMRQAAELSGLDELPEGDLSPLKKTFESLKSKLSELEGRGDGDVRQQIQGAIRPLQEKLEKAEAKARAQEERANRALVRETFSTELSKARAQKNALEFLLDRVEREFEAKDDKVVARDGVFGETGDPLTPADWVKSAIAKYDFAFEQSKGGGAPGSRSGGDNGVPAGVKILRNPSPEELGQHMKDISAGKVRIVNDSRP